MPNFAEFLLNFGQILAKIFRDFSKITVHDEFRTSIMNFVLGVKENEDGTYILIITASTTSLHLNPRCELRREFIGVRRELDVILDVSLDVSSARREPM